MSDGLGFSDEQELEDNEGPFDFRDSLKDALSQLDPQYHEKFKRKYAEGNLEASINEVVNSMDEKKLDLALEQVQKAIAKRKKEVDKAEGLKDKIEKREEDKKAKKQSQGDTE